MECQASRMDCFLVKHVYFMNYLFFIMPFLRKFIVLVRAVSRK